MRGTTNFPGKSARIEVGSAHLRDFAVPRTFNYGEERGRVYRLFSFDARNWKSFGGRFHSERDALRRSLRIRERSRSLTYLKAMPSLFASDTTRCESRTIGIR